jgi:hypothetical protein
VIGREHHRYVAAASPTGTPNRSVSYLPRLGHPSLVGWLAVALVLLRFDGRFDAPGDLVDGLGEAGPR